MTAAFHRLPGRPVPQRKPRTDARPPTVPPAPAPGREPFCLGQPLSALRDYVQTAREVLRLTGQPLSWDAAVVDYMLETDGGREEQFSLEDRAERWGWVIGKSSMHERMKRVREDAADRADLYQSKRRARAAEASEVPAPQGDRGGETRSQTSPNASRTPAERQPNAAEQKGPEKGQNEASAEQAPNATERLPNAGRTVAHHIPRATYLIPHTNTDDDGADARARAEGPVREEDLAKGDVTIAELTDSALRHRVRIEALLASSNQARLNFATRALKAGAVAQASVLLDVEAAASRTAGEVGGDAAIRAGPVALCAALVLTDAEADSDFAPKRLKHFLSTLDSILAHVDRLRSDAHQPAPSNPGQRTPPGRPDPARGADPGGRGRPRSGSDHSAGTGGRPAGTAAQRASSVSATGLRELLDRRAAERGDGAGPPAPGPEPEGGGGPHAGDG